MLRKITGAWLGIAVGLVATGPVLAQPAVEVLRAMHPGVRTYSAGHSFRFFYGAAMTVGATEADAASTFLALHRGAFGGPQSDGNL